MLLCKIFKLQSFDPQEYKYAGPSTRLIWCGTCPKSRFSNKENIPWDKNDLFKTLNTPNNFFWVLPSQRMGKSLEIAALPDFFLFFRVLVPRLVQHKIVAEQILQISFVSIKLMLGNTWDLRTLWHNKILRPIKDQFSGRLSFIWNCNNNEL